MGSRKTLQPQTSNGILIPKIYCFFIALLLLSLIAYIGYREHQISHLVEAGIFYEEHIKGYTLDPEWQMTKEELRRETKIINRLLVERGSNKITREQLGRQSWGFLHMVSTTAPDQISETMKEQFNTFLMLFAKFYPCKLCANYFVRTLRKLGEFKGVSRMQLMDYVCKVHNKVNRRLKKKQYDCDMVPADWGTCSCFSSNPINTIK